MIFALIMFVFQNQHNAVASTCTSNANVAAAVLEPAAPELSKPPQHEVSVEITVTVAPSGNVKDAKVSESSGDAAIDAAVLTAAKKSTYSPKIVDCVPVVGTYLFRADLAP